MSLCFIPTAPLSLSICNTTHTCTNSSTSFFPLQLSWRRSVITSQPTSTSFSHNLPYHSQTIKSCQNPISSTSDSSLSHFSSLTSLSSTPDHEINSIPLQETSYDSGAGSFVGGGSSDDSGNRGQGDDNESGDSDASDQQLSALLKTENATLSQIPSDILGAYRSGLIGLSALSNFFAAIRNPLSRILMGCGAGMRNRFLADRLFLLKILIEEGIGIFGKLSAEYEQRRQNFWKEGEFVFANLITAILADFALVYLPAPSVVLKAASKGGGIGAWLGRLATELPSNIFQTDRPFTMTQRAGGFALKAGQLFVVGMMCCFVGVAMTNSLVYIREKIDKDYKPQTQKPNPLLVSALYATFLGLSSGSRYQLVNGIESHLFPRIFAKTPKLAEEVATFVLRYGNTFWGSQQWVMFCRFTNVQKTKQD